MNWYADQNLMIRVLVLIAALVVIEMFAFGVQRLVS